jgi:5,10-methenyltetrahydrofolate synthetase
MKTKSQWREQIQSEWRHQKLSVIPWFYDHLLDHLKAASGVWGVYRALRGELATSELLADPRCQHLTWVFPRVMAPASSHSLEFWPEGSATLMLPVPSEKISGLLIPALAIDATGVRLGRGGGHYDRFLTEFRGERWGLVPENRFVEALPCEEFDQRVDFVVTERRVVKILRC